MSERQRRVIILQDGVGRKANTGRSSMADRLELADRLEAHFDFLARCDGLDRRKCPTLFADLLEAIEILRDGHLGRDDDA